ncbi:MAG TPA: N(5)-(carboxyethyl)ornithine synthase [Actinomycetota bacterium]|nr:N(5)-(carboxyethyl)ornithine synthase [Actinomycetota bacterium]
MNALSLGVMGTSNKENERRLPIHPHHVERIDADLRARMTLEAGYGQAFGVPDHYLARQVRALLPREEVIADSDIVLLPKPTLADLGMLRERQVLWGWPHAVQDPALTQIAIDKHLTLIAWEQMNHWTPAGDFMVHVFHLNNEMAGYCSVLHAMTLLGVTGHYGRHLRAVVIGFGNTARGAITALHGLGVHEVTALTMRDVTAVASPIPAVVMDHMHRVDGDRIMVTADDQEIPVAQFLAGFDVVVNCVLQDTDRPMMFVRDDELSLFPMGHLIVDVSCDRGMGFGFARPTSFDNPMFTVGDGVHYYGVDHSPTYLWNSATWGISEALIPFLRPVMAGPQAWEDDPSIALAIEIREGVVRNPKILSFQGRTGEYPHRRP